MIFFDHPFPIDQYITGKTYREIKIENGVLLTVEENGHRIIHRVISTDPAVFLNPAYQPGSYL